MADEKAQQGSSLSLKELLIAAGSSAAAFLVVPLFWENGTLFATAMTPVIVAIARELIARPVETAAQVGRRVSAVAPAPTVARRRQGGGRPRPAPAPAPAPPSAEDRFGLRQDERRRAWRRRALRVGILTGLLAFVVVAVVATFSEIVVFGKSLAGGDGGGDRPTLVPGGSGSGSDEEDAEETEDQERRRDQEETDEPAPNRERQPAEEETPDPDATPTPEATPTPGATPTPSATPGATPTPGAAPTVTPAP